jgi:hypothetical protein
MMTVLQQMKALQAQPMIPNNDLARAGSIMTSFNAGLTGKADPSAEMFRKDRHDQLQNLNSQAGISAHLATLENFKATRAEALKRYNLDAFKALKDSEDFNTRVSAFKSGIQAGILPQDLDPNLAAMKTGKEYEKGHDQVLALIQKGIDPTADPKYASMFPKEVFGPVVMQAQQAMAQGGGPLALNQLRLKPDQPENVMKVEVARLEMIPQANRTPEDQRQLDAYSKALKLDPKGTELERWAQQLMLEDQQAGKPLKQFSAYLQAANDAKKDRDSTNQVIEKTLIAEKKWGKPGEPGFERQRLTELAILAGARAAASQDAQRLPDRERNMLQILDTAKNHVVNRLLTEFTPAERMKYSGWLNFEGRQLMQAVQADPKFAQFRSYVKQGQSMAFSDGGKNLTQFEGGITFGWIPTGKEMSPVDFEEKLKLAGDRLDYIRDRVIHYAVTPTSDITKDMKKAVTGPPPQPKTPTGRPFRFIKQPDGSIKVEPN